MRGEPMNLLEMFVAQRELDLAIYKNHPVKPGEDRFAKKILSFVVEIGEMANELPEIFKYWSNKKNNYERALEEYVDALHFLLSIGNEYGCQLGNVKRFVYPGNVVVLISSVIRRATTWPSSWNEYKDEYKKLFIEFILLGQKLGFAWEDVESAYYAKNKINYERQENGY